MLQLVRSKEIEELVEDKVFVALVDPGRVLAWVDAC